MMAMLDLGERDPLPPQVCMLYPQTNPFSGMCDLSLPADWKPPQEPRGPRRASLSGGAALKEFGDSSALWRPFHHSTPKLLPNFPTMSNLGDNARRVSAIDLLGWLG